MIRYALSVVMNCLVPGTGLMVLGRPWLGLALAVWFGLGVEVAVFGALIAPATMPRWVVVTSAILAGASWLLAQGQLVSRIQFLRDPGIMEELEVLRQHAEASLAAGNLKAARSALLIALSLDEADLATRVLWARVLTQSGRTGPARRAWARVARLDTDGRFDGETRAALDRLAAT